MKQRYLKKITKQKLLVIFMVICSSLINGTAIGQTSYYVNDNSTSGDTYTSAVGVSGNAGTSSAPFATIAAAISAASAGDVIYVDAGTYAEEIWIDKPLTLRGPNANIAGNGSRVAEAIMQFPLSTVASGHVLIYVGDAANGVMSGVTIEGLDLRCQDATIPKYLNVIYTNRINNLTIRNNRVYSSEIPIYILTSNSQNVYCTGMLIEGNYVDCGPNVNNSFNRGIYVQATSGTIQDNQFLNANTGIQYMPYSHTTSGLIRRNTVTASNRGLYHNYQNKGAAQVTWEQNEVTVAPNPQTGLSAQVDGASTTPTTFRGIHFINFGTEGSGSSPAVTFQNNKINAANPGGTTSTVFRAVLLQTSNAGNVTLSNNSFTNYTEGIVRNTDATTTTVNATCNWWGSSATANVTTAASSATSFNPWLNSGSDVNAAIGFQPDNTTCTGGTPISLNESHVNIVCSGGTTGSINLTVSGGTSPFSYAWTKSGDVSYSASTEDLSNLASGTYTVVVTDANNATATTSIEITSGTVSYPVITTQPTKVGRKVALNLPATPYTITVAASSSLTYQWYSNTTASNAGGVLIAGATSNSYTPPTSTAYTAYFYCVVSNGSCSRASDVSEVFIVCN